MRVGPVMIVIALAACSPAGEKAAEAPANGELPAGPVAKIDKVEAAAIPAEIAPLAEATIPGMKIAEAERKERDGRLYYDVEGTRPDGSEVELDVLVEDGKYRVVEIQRDIAWASAAPLAFLEACLGLRCDFARRELRFERPMLPEFIDELCLRRLRLGDAEVDILLRRHTTDVGLNVISRRGDVRVIVVN